MIHRITKFLFWLISGTVCAIGIFLWQTHPQLLSASLAEIISNGSGGVHNPSGVDLQLPVIPGATAEEKIDRVSLSLINIILYVCGTAAGIMIVIGGIRYILSAGSEDMRSGAKKTILWAAGGLVMTFLAWAIVLNIVRIASLEERLDSSQNPLSGSCGQDITMFCKDTCCGCTGKNDCADGLQCGGPMDVAIFESIGFLRDTIRVCQPIAEK